MKYVSDIVAPIFSHICNEMLNKGIFSDKLKKSRVPVVHEGGDRNLFLNYCPISVLSLFSKVDENVIDTRLIALLEKRNSISFQLHGFQNAKATERALMHANDEIINNTEDKRFTVELFLDLKEAFDSVNHLYLNFHTME